MKIGIVIDKLYPGKIGGAEQYVRNTISIMENKENVELILFLNEAAMESFEKKKSDKVHRVCVPYQIQQIKEYYEYYIAKYSIQVLFCPLFYIPYESCSIPMVISILDIQHEYYPEYFAPDLLQYRRDETRKAIENASAIITISEFSKTTMIEKLGVDKDKIFVTHLNSDSSFDREIDKEKNMVMKNRLPEHYFFYPANGWAHKNHKKLIDAYQLLKEKYATDCKLVLTGNAFNDENGLQTYIQEKGLEKDVITLGYIEQEEMPYVFANADMLVFPSLFEGFGIPLVEAMRMGTPIACSNCGSIPEIAEDAAIIFDARDENDIADKLHRLKYDVNLQKELRKRGYQRAKAFSWEKCAEQTLEVLKESAIEEAEVKEKVSVPKVTILLPVFENTENVRKLIESVACQTYSDKDIIVFGGDRHVLNEIRKSMGEYSVKIRVLKQKKLGRFLTQEISKNAKDIIGVLQVGQVLTDIQTLEHIVVELIKNQEDVLWIKPQKEDFWGIFLESRIESRQYQKFIQFDQAALSVLFIKSRKSDLFEGTLHWFYGHYQELVWEKLLRECIRFQIMPEKSILDKSRMSGMKEKGYRKSLRQMWKREGYIPLALINTEDIFQKKLIQKLVENNADIKRYYEQIENRGVEFDGILSDGWISRRCELEVEIGNQENSLEIIGINSDIEEMTVTIFMDKRVVVWNNIGIGEFQLRAKLPADIELGRHTLQIEVDKTFSYYERTKHDILAFSVRICKLAISDDIIWGK